MFMFMRQIREHWYKECHTMVDGRGVVRSYWYTRIAGNVQTHANSHCNSSLTKPNR